MSYQIQINDHQRNLIVQALAAAHRDEYFVAHFLKLPSDNGEPDALADATNLMHLFCDLPAVELKNPGSLHGFDL